MSAGLIAGQKVKSTILWGWGRVGGAVVLTDWCFAAVTQCQMQKTLLFAHEKTKAQISCPYRAADQCLCLRYTDSTIPLVTKFEISSV